MLLLLKDLRIAHVLATAAAVALFFTGCGSREQIARYSVQKPELVDPTPVSTAPQVAAIEQEMLGAIVPTGNISWFFKLVGDPQSVDPQRESFLTFVKSTKFTAAPGSNPSWTLPDDWTQLPGDQIRYATIRLPDVSSAGRPLEITVSSLGGEVLANVNRWRGQLNLKPIAADELAKTSETFKVGDYDCTFVRLIGTSGGGMTAGGMSGAPFAPFAGGGGGGGATPRTSTGKRPASGNIAYQAPPEWTAGTPNQFSVASFSVSDGSKQVQITVSSAGGDLVANVNRWRGQLHLSPASASELEKSLTKINALGDKGDFVELTGTNDQGQPETILGVIAIAGGQTWFIKLKGDAELAAREKPRFEAFVKSLQLK